MKVSWKQLMVGALAALLVAPLAFAVPQSQSQGQPPAKPPVQPGQTPAQPPATTPAQPETPPVNAKEEADYKLFFELPKADSQRVIEMGEDFVKKYPESRYREAIYSRMVNSYLNLDQVDKMFVTGEKALEINPNNVDVLSAVTWAVPRRLTPTDLDAQQKLAKVEGYGKKAIDIITAMPKPEMLTEEDFTKAKSEKLAMVHSGLGVVHWHRQKFADMATELEEAIKLSAAADPVDYYLLGMAYKQTRRWSDAATAFEKCSEAGPVTDRCKGEAQAAKKNAAATPKP